MKNIVNFLRELKYYFITGLLGLTPFVIAIWIITILYSWIKEAIILNYKNNFNENETFWAIGILFLLFLSISALGMQISKEKKSITLHFFQKTLNKFPLIGKITSTIKQMIDMLNGKGKFENLGVARVPFQGGKTNALLTDCIEKNGRKEYTTFIVTGTFPPVGFVAYYYEEDIEIMPDMTAKDVFELQITVGIKN